jgi:hypothetical protein
LVVGSGFMDLQNIFCGATATRATPYRASARDSIKNPFAKGAGIRHISIVVSIRDRTSDCAVNEAGATAAGR